MLPENFTVLRTFNAQLEGVNKATKVEQLLGVRSKQDVVYRIYVGVTRPEDAYLFSHANYWQLNPVEVKG